MFEQYKYEYTLCINSQVLVLVSGQWYWQNTNYINDFDRLQRTILDYIRTCRPILGYSRLHPTTRMSKRRLRPLLEMYFSFLQLFMEKVHNREEKNTEGNCSYSNHCQPTISTVMQSPILLHVTVSKYAKSMSVKVYSLILAMLRQL